jgi:hypothetical protein
MYFLGQTPVEPTGVPVATTMPAAVVEAVVSAVPEVSGSAPASPAPEPVPAIVSDPAPAPPAPGSSLPRSISTGAPAPVDYSTRRRHDSGSEHHQRHSGWRQPVNIFYTDPTPYYYPPPVDYRESPSPVYVIRERSAGFPKVNWLLVLAVASLAYLLKP